VLFFKSLGRIVVVLKGRFRLIVKLNVGLYDLALFSKLYFYIN
jgi:hypothetical protein